MQDNKNNIPNANEAAMAFLNNSVVKDIIQNIESIESKCKDKIGIDVIQMRTQQLSLSKILFNVYEKDIMYLIKAYTQLAVSYIDIDYFEQAQEHLLSAFKLIENLIDDSNLTSKEYQIKILINLAKCYLENGKVSTAFSIGEKCLKINQTLMGAEHISNVEFFYVLAKVNTKMKHFEGSLENLNKIFNIYEKEYGYESEKTAKIFLEIAEIYEKSNCISESVENYKNSFSIWEKIIKDENFEVLVTLAIKISELQVKVDNYGAAYEFLKYVIIIENKCLSKISKIYKFDIIYAIIRQRPNMDFI